MRCAGSMRGVDSEDSRLGTTGILVCCGHGKHILAQVARVRQPSAQGHKEHAYVHLVERSPRRDYRRGRGTRHPTRGRGRRKQVNMQKGSDDASDQSRIGTRVRPFPHARQHRLTVSAGNPEVPGAVIRWIVGDASTHRITKGASWPSLSVLEQGNSLVVNVALRWCPELTRAGQGWKGPTQDGHKSIGHAGRERGRSHGLRQHMSVTYVETSILVALYVTSTLSTVHRTQGLFPAQSSGSPPERVSSVGSTSLQRKNSTCGRGSSPGQFDSWAVRFG